MTKRLATFSARLPSWGRLPSHAPSLLRELPIMLGGLALFYALLALARTWVAPVSGTAEISLAPSVLPKYAMFSILRIAIAYFLSLAFAVAYGYVAAYNPRAERFMVPLLDALQSKMRKS